MVTTTTNNNGSKSGNTAQNSTGKTATVAPASSSSTGTSNQQQSSRHSRLEFRFPVNSVWELTLTSGEKVEGTVYCTDEVSQSLVLQKPLVHTTLSSDIRIIHVPQIVQADRKEISADSADNSTLTSLSAPLPKIQKRALEERERKAIRLAEENLRHINQAASPEGQAVFDRLLKACNDVVWKGESILVLNQVQVDPPYGPEQCKIVQRSANGKKSLEDGSLQRVKKIVAAVSAPTTASAAVT